jgi:hypothetical protein
MEFKISLPRTLLRISFVASASLRAARCVAVMIGASALLLSCPHPKLQPPTKGTLYVDSLYGATIIRISDKTIDGYSGPGIQNECARADAWNTDQSYLTLCSNDGHFYLYSAVDYRLIRDLNALAGGQRLEPRWSLNDPNHFCFLAGSRLREYDIPHDTSRTIHNFQHEFPNCTYVTTGAGGDASNDQRYWCLMVTDGTFGLIAAAVYDLNQDTVVGIKTSFPDAVNFTTMDASGKHAVIGYDSHPLQSFHPDFTHAVDFVHGAAGHSDIALTRDGRDVVVYQNEATNFIAMTDLETGAETSLLAIPFDTNPDIGLHVSGNCYDVPGWALVSTYGAVNPPSGHAHSWMDNLLFMVELKPNPRVVKLAQTLCCTGTEPGTNHLAEAFASIDRGGTRAVYGSNWGILTQDYTDAYEVRLPANWNR